MPSTETRSRNSFRAIYGVLPWANLATRSWNPGGSVAILIAGAPRAAEDPGVTLDVWWTSGGRCRVDRDGAMDIASPTETFTFYPGGPAMRSPREESRLPDATPVGSRPLLEMAMGGVTCPPPAD